MELEALKQQDWIEFICEKHGTETWVSVYKRIEDGSDSGSLYCGLISKDSVERSLSGASWELHIGGGGPGFVTSYENGEEVTEYYRNSGLGEAEHLVIARDFYGVKPNYKEIAEEFRLFQNLYFDSKSNKYIKILDSGEGQDAIILDKNEIKIRLRFLMEYISAKQMILALYFDIRRDLQRVISEEEQEEVKLDIREQNLAITRYAGNLTFGDLRAFSRLLGKKLIFPEPLERSGIWPFATEPVYQSYIIGEDENGRPIEYSSDPDRLEDYFGANPEAPHYLTPVFFRKDVLAKYFNKPSLYTIEDSYLHCAGLWGLRMDNNHRDYVCVFLGDLGRDLPEDEQRYWRSFNVPPEGSISETYFRRSFLAEFTDPEKEDLILKSKLSIFSSDWEKKFGWPLLLRLDEKDQHLLSTLRIPLSEDQAEFDNQILALTKILIDSLNEKSLSSYLENDTNELKGISKLEKFLESQSFPDYETHIYFLRSLYGLRSSGVGHRKGKKYDKAVRRLGFEGVPLSTAFIRLCENTIQFLDEMRAFFLENEA